uniref:Cytohesin 1 interacting protein n=1 Tax=Athene cunicularia TaxID=194338 RepID=A0A663LKG1_ATHCN
MSTPLSRWLPLGVTSPIPLVPLVLLKLGQSSRLVGETYPSALGKDKTGKCHLQWLVLQDPRASLGALGLARSSSVGLRAEITTIRFPHQNDNSLEVCTCVCKIQEESPAHLSGLQIGDILSGINGVNTDGFSHKQIVDLIKSSGNYLRLETVNGAMFLRKMELETKLQLLKQTLQQKWVEVRSLLVREQRLLHGTALELEGSSLLDGSATPGPLFPTQPRFPSESSSRSRLSSMTLGSEDSFCLSGAFEDSAAESLSRQSSVDDDCFFPRDGDGAAGRSSLRRNRSISLASSGSMSPLWEGGSRTSSFGTLPRKSRRSSVRKQLLKFIPGLHWAVEEEESRV